MKPINIFDIENYIFLYQPLLEIISNDSAHSSLCAHYTSSKMPIKYAAINYPFANLPQKNSCFSLDRLAQVDKRKIWNCPEHPQMACPFYRYDVFQIFQSSLFDSVGKEIIYTLICNRNKNGYIYYIYNLTERSVKQIYSIPYVQEDLNEKAIVIFKEYIDEVYNAAVSSFEPDYFSTNKEEEILVSEKQRSNSFLLSLVSVD